MTSCVMFHVIHLADGLQVPTILLPPHSPVLGLWALEAMPRFLCGCWGLNSVLISAQKARIPTEPSSRA